MSDGKKEWADRWAYQEASPSSGPASNHHEFDEENHMWENKKEKEYIWRNQTL